LTYIFGVKIHKYYAKDTPHTQNKIEKKSPAKNPPQKKLPAFFDHNP